ncbi:MAG: hypothetical protein QW265_02770 [Candidatus Bathyarchaeia archaeon]
MYSPDEKYGHILMLEERWWVKFNEYAKTGKKIHAHVRAGIAGPKRTTLVFFYAIYPVMEIKGYGDFIERVAGDSKELWDLYHNETCLESYDQYRKLIGMRESATFIRFKNLHEGMNSIPFSKISEILGIKRMPRKGRYVNEQESSEFIKLLG